MTAITLTPGDITKLRVDAIVNAANSRLAGGGGVDGAIHAAGGREILEECRLWVAENGLLPTGEAMVTTAGDLPSTYVIHTVGPIWGNHDEESARRLLGSCYATSLDRARERGCETVAFPNISTGIYGFPKSAAAETAVAAVREWVGNRPDLAEILFVCHDPENRSIYSGLLES